jgi:outer membrane protein assembly factor BamB
MTPACRFFALLVLLLVSRVGGQPSSQTRAESATSADWSMYNHDPAGWRFNAAEKTLSPANVSNLVEKWRFPKSGSEETVGVVHATPTVVAGEVYFGTATLPAFYKLAPDGTLRWIYHNTLRKTDLPESANATAAEKATTDKLKGAARGGGIFSSALVVNGAVYFADNGGWMYCLDAETGGERWKVDTRAETFPNAHFNNILMASPILADGKVVFSGGTLEQLFAGTVAYPGSTGRGFLVALDPQTGTIVWKYDVGTKPVKLDPPVVVKDSWGEHKWNYGPATSSVWSTPSYDAESNTLFLGTDVNTSPRQPTPHDPRLTTEDSCAVVCLDAATGKRRWNTQINPGDLWNNSMRAYDPATGLYKDCSIGDTPKIFTIDVDGAHTTVVGVGCKNGGFYLLRADSGKLIKHTPLYSGPPTDPPEAHDPRVLALPSSIGGLQSGCATDGRTIFTNGIDALGLGTQERLGAGARGPTGGRVTATSIDLATERWRHERPKVAEMGGTPGKPAFTNVGDICGSGVAVGNGVVYFTAVGSGKLIVLDAESGSLLKEIDLGPVFCGPSLSRGRVYVGSGNTLWGPREHESYFPKKFTGGVLCFGLPGEDEVDRMRAER